MKKEQYQSFFAYVCKFLNLSYFCNQVGIKRSNLSTFIKYGNLGALSIDSLDELYRNIMETLNNVA